MAVTPESTCCVCGRLLAACECTPQEWLRNMSGLKCENEELQGDVAFLRRDAKKLQARIAALETVLREAGDSHTVRCSAKDGSECDCWQGKRRKVLEQAKE